MTTNRSADVAGRTAPAGRRARTGTRRVAGAAAGTVLATVAVTGAGALVATPASAAGAAGAGAAHADPGTGGHPGRSAGRHGHGWQARSGDAPAPPTLEPYYPTPTSRLVSDGRVSLAVGGLAAGPDRPVSITVRYGRHRSVDVPVPAGGTAFTTVTGLANGTGYTFTARACSAAGTCSTSAPVTFTPYGFPVVPAVAAHPSAGGVVLEWGTVDRQASPLALECAVRLEGDPAGAVDVAVDPDRPGSAEVPATPGTVAVYRCSVGGGRALVRSAPVTVPLTTGPGVRPRG